MNKDTRNIYESYITEDTKDDNRIETIRREIAGLNQELASLQPSQPTPPVAPAAANTAAPATNNDLEKRKGKEPETNPSVGDFFRDPPPGHHRDKDGNYVRGDAPMTVPRGDNSVLKRRGFVGDDPYGEIAAGSPEDFNSGGQNDSETQHIGGTSGGFDPQTGRSNMDVSDDQAAAFNAANPEDATGSDKPDPWKQEQTRINQTRDMPGNWRNGAWAKRARMMGRGSDSRVKQAAAKEWNRMEQMRKERELATSKLNPNRQSSLGYHMNQIGKAPGNIAKSLVGMGKKLVGGGTSVSPETNSRQSGIASKRR